MPSAYFQPPSSEGKPQVPRWVPPEPTKEELDWAQLHTIDLSILDSQDPGAVEQLVELTKTAMKDDGFLYLVRVCSDAKKVTDLHLTRSV